MIPKTSQYSEEEDSINCSVRSSSWTEKKDEEGKTGAKTVSSHFQCCSTMNDRFKIKIENIGCSKLINGAESDRNFMVIVDQSSRCYLLS